MFEEESPGDVIPKSRNTIPEMDNERLEIQFGNSPRDDFGEVRTANK